MGIQSAQVKGDEVLLAFEEYGGLDVLEMLQSHPNYKVYVKAH